MSESTQNLELHHVEADEVHLHIGRSMLADGFPFVVDLDRSQGSHLVNKLDGRPYLDFFNYFATQPLGHNHPGIVDDEFLRHIGRVALTKPSNSDFYTQEMATFVKVLGETAQPESMPYLFFISGGALAVENALKAAFDWKFQKRAARGLPDDENLEILHFKEAFHGRSGYTMSLTNTDPTKTRWFPKFDWPRVSNPKVRFPIADHLPAILEAEAKCVAEIQRVIDERGDRVAALIIEPIQGEGGDNHFRPEFLQQLRRITLENEMLFIVDEVQTGVGTTGEWWAYQNYGFEPDILCFGKKMQVCGIMAGRRLDEVNSVFKVSSRINSTWGGNLVDMVRATRYLQIIQRDDLVRNAAVQGEYFLKGLLDLQTKHSGKIENVRGLGLFVAFTLPTRDLRQALLAHLLEERMLALSSGQTSVRFRPPLNVTAAEIDEALDLVDKGLSHA